MRKNRLYWLGRNQVRTWSAELANVPPKARRTRLNLYLCLRNRAPCASSLMSSTPAAARTTLLSKHKNILGFLLLIIPLFFADIGYASGRTSVHPPRVAEKAFAELRDAAVDNDDNN